MKESQFISAWEKYHKIGQLVYILIYAVVLPLAGLLGKGIGEYISMGVFFRTLRVQDYLGLIFICLIGCLIGKHSWKSKEKRYDKYISKK
jgi:uncharacterized membrane protein AbrB (regulator of aidB expression)